ncbi:MAG: hypothetical protein MUE34_13945, partial [Acidimicrobiales bacterium]|nr:hypothetical protein [Acidimicrobiales bacterium]
MVFRRRARSARSKRGDASHVVYSRWDGSQTGFDFDAEDLLSQMLDDLVYDGDPNSALRRMMLEGFKDRNGQEIQGIRDLLDRLRRERQQRLEQ